jgi:5'-nucleotidase
MKRHALFVVFLVSALLLLLGCSSSGSHTKTPTITLIGTSDLQGHLEPEMQKYDINGSEKEVEGGGISRIATLLKQAEKENPRGTIIASNGDDLMGRYFHTFKGEAIYTLLGRSGYRLYAPGNHEFDKGPEVFAQALDFASFDMLCSDLAIAGTPLEGRCKPYTILEIEGTKVGVFSLMTEELPLITSAGSVKLKASNQKSAEAMVTELRGRGCTVVIALTHIGLDQDKRIAKSVSGIDVIFGGHSHRANADLVRVNDTLIFNGGEQGSYVVRIDLPLDAAGRIDKAAARYQRIPVLGSIQKDSDVESLLETYKSQLPASIVLGTTTVEWDLTETALRQNESSVADMINDLLRDKLEVEIVMNNAGAFRGKKIYPPGPITDTRLHEIDEFNNNAYILDIEGRYIRQILEHSASLYGRGGLMQVSGIRYTIDLSKQAQAIAQDSKGEWYITQPGARVTHIEVATGEGSYAPLEESRHYRLLSNAYLVNHDGDGYFWFKRYGKNPKNTFTTFYTVMAGYLEAHKVMNPKPIDGRLTILHR